MDRQTSSSAQPFSLAKFLADWLDQRFTIPATLIRIGFYPILGSIPGNGDIIANLAGSAIILIAAQYRLPKIVFLPMGLNVALNAIIGPFRFLVISFPSGSAATLKMPNCSSAMSALRFDLLNLGNWILVIGIISGLFDCDSVFGCHNWLIR